MFFVSGWPLSGRCVAHSTNSFARVRKRKRAFHTLTDQTPQKEMALPRPTIPHVDFRSELLTLEDSLSIPTEESGDLHVDHDLYALLNCSRDATEKELHASWLRLSRAFHPDKVRRRRRRNNSPISGSDSDSDSDSDPNFSEATLATEYQQAVNEAYRILSNPLTRRIYDRAGRISLVHGFGIIIFLSLFQMSFRTANQRFYSSHL